ncbi:MAG: hypothetical protein RLZZ496_1598 [Pseudomonadota bacterium]
MTDALNSRLIQRATGSQNEYRFTFQGRTKTYFGIWIVNVLLNIVTLGIYSAWAKVRRLRYFYENTWLDGYNFSYHAEPVKILIGRAIVVGALILYNILVTISPFFVVLLIAYVFLLPVIINASFSFSLRMTSFRGVRFGFRGDYWPAFGIYIALPLFVILTAGLALPLYTKLSWRYLGSRLRYGSVRAEIAPPLGALYAQFGLSIIVLIIGMLPFVLIPTAFNSTMTDEVSSFSIWHWTFVAFYIGLMMAAIFYNAGTRNVVLSTLIIDRRHQLHSELGRLAMIWIGISNLFAIIFTLGLAWPWASVRRWRYQVDHLTLIGQGPLDNISGMSGVGGEVTAAEFVDLEGFDFGL